MTQQELIQQKILTPEALEHQLAIWRFKSQKIVFTNGCFDLLHPGHLHTLAEARNKGNVLIVGLNADVSVTKLKGPNRPIFTEQLRAEQLAALYMVDAVVLFEEETPIKLIDQIKPDVLVKGGDYNINTIVGADLVMQYGGAVETVPFLEGYSTTRLEELLRNM